MSAIRMNQVLKIKLKRYLTEIKIMTEEQINKLPKWAQSDFRALTIRLNEVNAELKRINENTPSNTQIQTFGDEAPKYLKNGEGITFTIENGEVNCRVKGDCLEVRGNSLSSEHEMAIRPRVSNVIRIKFVED